jgi:hypothetical protein
MKASYKQLIFSYFLPSNNISIYVVQIESLYMKRLWDNNEISFHNPMDAL